MNEGRCKKKKSRGRKGRKKNVRETKLEETRRQSGERQQYLIALYNTVRCARQQLLSLLQRVVCCCESCRLLGLHVNQHSGVSFMEQDQSRYNNENDALSSF